MATQSIDVAHSEIGFVVRHMVFSKVRGQFKKWSATLDYDAADPTKSRVGVEIETASIDTREEDRDKHLRSADFLDTEKFPKMIFASKRIERAGKDRYKLVGDLTIHGATNEVTLDVEATGGGADPWGNQRAGFSAKTTILRSQWGLKWNQALEAGGVLVSDKVDVEVEVEVVLGKA
ncbi:YceI family protein [Pendulispora albinea]|uniref:YceI family protein n=1 Tax=Pendulispora albinea TaxID=2741071 RepID=A0ABZ2M3F0_9BACT